MPLVDMGLIGRFDARHGDTPGVSQRRHRDTDRTVRCVAGFYEGVGDVEVVSLALRSQFGLGEAQVSVIRPSGLTRRTFDRVAWRWRCLRPASGLGGLLSTSAVGALTGLVSAALALAFGSALAQAGDPMVDVLAFWIPGLAAGALAGAVTAALLARRQANHRFDETVIGKLRRGFGVVVAHGLDEQHQAPVLAYLQGTSHSWCAEAPQRQLLV